MWCCSLQLITEWRACLSYARVSVLHMHLSLFPAMRVSQQVGIHNHRLYISHNKESVKVEKRRFQKALCSQQGEPHHIAVNDSHPRNEVTNSRKTEKETEKRRSHSPPPHPQRWRRLWGTCSSSEAASPNEDDGKEKAVGGLRTRRLLELKRWRQSARVFSLGRHPLAELLAIPHSP